MLGPGVVLLLCGFGPLSAPAVGCGNLYSAPPTVVAPHRNGRNRPSPLSCSCVGLGHFPLQPLAAETFIPHRPNGSHRKCSPGATQWPLSWPCHAFLLLCGFGPFSAPAVGCGNLYSAPHRNGTGPQRSHRSHTVAVALALPRAPRCLLPCGFLAQPLAAEAFIPHRTATAGQHRSQRHRQRWHRRWPCPAPPVALPPRVGPALQAPLRNGTLATGQPPYRHWPHSCAPRSPSCSLAPVSCTAFGCGSHYSATALNYSTGNGYGSWLRYCRTATATPVALPPRVCSYSTPVQASALFLHSMHRNSLGTLHGRQRLAPARWPCASAPRCLAPVWVWHSLWLRKPLFRTAPQRLQSSHRQRWHRHAGPALRVPRPPLPCSRVGLAQPLAAETFIPHRNGTVQSGNGGTRHWPCLAPPVALLPCGFGTAFGCGSLYSAPQRYVLAFRHRQRRHRHTGPAFPPVALLPCGFGTAFGCGSLYSAPQRYVVGNGNGGTGTLALPFPPVALLPCRFGTAFGCGSKLFRTATVRRRNGNGGTGTGPAVSPPVALLPCGLAQPLAAEAFIPHRTATSWHRQRWHRHRRCLALAVPCSRVPLPQPLAAKAFIPHRSATVAPAPATVAPARWPCLAPPLPCPRVGLAQPLAAAEAFIPHRTRTSWHRSHRWQWHRRTGHSRPRC